MHGRRVPVSLILTPNAPFFERILNSWHWQWKRIFRSARNENKINLRGEGSKKSFLQEFDWKRPAGLLKDQLKKHSSFFRVRARAWFFRVNKIWKFTEKSRGIVTLSIQSIINSPWKLSKRTSPIQWKLHYDASSGSFKVSGRSAPSDETHRAVSIRLLMRWATSRGPLWL